MRAHHLPFYCVDRPVCRHDMLNGVKEEEFQGFRCYVYHRGVERRQLQQVQDLLPGGEVTSDEGLDEIIEIKNEVVRREESCLVELVKTHIGSSAWMRLRTLRGLRTVSHYHHWLDPVATHQRHLDIGHLK